MFCKTVNNVMQPELGQLLVQSNQIHIHYYFNKLQLHTYSIRKVTYVLFTKLSLSIAYLVWEIMFLGLKSEIRDDK